MQRCVVPLLLAFAIGTLVVFASPRHNLGTEVCTYGPSFWCGNLTNAKSCHAVPHCIRTVWEHMEVVPDHDSVCEICVKMVGQARDQLESNETQEELKEVFDGSCNLIPLKAIKEECYKLVNDFVPELVETLSSQMNPQVVCSVAGLCNNPRIDRLLEEQKKKEEQELASEQCNGCSTVVALMERNFKNAPRDSILQGFLRACGRAGSFSDSCTNIILNYFEDIYTKIYNDFSPDQVCLLSGQCSAMYHTHNDPTDIEVTPMSKVGFVKNKDDNIPCELCEQLVGHLRDVLVANTTEDEFKMVLEGLCNATRSFAQECNSLVEQYYPSIYSFLVSELDANGACAMIGICPSKEGSENAPIWPLVSPENAEKMVKIVEKVNGEKDREEMDQEYRGGHASLHVINPDLMQLPIERMVPKTLTLIGNQQLCTFCEYFLHFVQEAITGPAFEQDIERIVGQACDSLPKSVEGQCLSFVSTYGPAVVALLAQEIDPSQVCPLLSLCPRQEEVKDIEILMRSKSDKPNCPLCLFAVTELDDYLKNNKTEANILEALNTLCSHLSKNLAGECQDFVSTYTKELVEMLVADFTPQEVCVYLKLCKDKNPAGTIRIPVAGPHFGAEIMTNEIYDNTVNGRVPEENNAGGPSCSICVQIVKMLEEKIDKNKTKEEIDHIVKHICDDAPKFMANDCKTFIHDYGDFIVEVLSGLVEPKELCSVLNVCSLDIVQGEIADCAVCEAFVTTLDHLIENPKVDRNIEHLLKKACSGMPANKMDRCQQLIDSYGKLVFKIIEQGLKNSNEICRKINMCKSQAVRPDILVGANRCAWGPGYWCQSMENAKACGDSAIQHCQQNYWV